jgi:hypothetical protein
MGNLSGGTLGTPFLNFVGRRRRNILTFTFGDGSSNYPSGGVPMPATTPGYIGLYGLTRVMDAIYIVNTPADGYVYQISYSTSSGGAPGEKAIASPMVRIWESPAVASAPAAAGPLSEVASGAGGFVPASGVVLTLIVEGW